MLATAAFIARFSSALFSGAAVYVSFVEHPARLQTGTEAAVTEFGPSYRRGAVMQASLAAIGCLAGVAAWWTGGCKCWLFGSAVLGLLIPYTLIFIFPTNKRLLDPALDRSSPEALLLLRRWGRLQAVRTLGGVAALVTFLLSR